ncbi:MAG: PhoH family protein [Gammaproteobacteria bacterium]|nr:PhoH family protein [Gammaproteobacteria bacterium]MCY4165285.1 PhoH family protein [Gammaproteobacteria bacterium]MCY4340389.1 PhoH family protein [Gammaproteobacteria bacterium]
MDVVLRPANNGALANLCGELDRHLRQIEQGLGVRISNKGNRFRVRGAEAASRAGAAALNELYRMAAADSLDAPRIQAVLSECAEDAADSAGKAATAGGTGRSAPAPEDDDMRLVVNTPRIHVRPRGANQRRYVQAIRSSDLTFGVGPAGTGKTWLAVACALEAHRAGQIQRIVLVRPAVEAGERLGFLPGDLASKVDPYLRPVYDALYAMLGPERVAQWTERGIIEVAPLAYMRGRSLNGSFVILDEGQNTTPEQMKMFLTRFGADSRAVVTGDITQVDLPRDRESGLRHALSILKSISGIATVYFSSRDVVRHALVRRILDAYQAQEQP